MFHQFLLYIQVNQVYIHVYSLFFRFFSHIGHHRVLSRVPRAILLLLLLLLSGFSRVRLCATPQTAAQQAPPSLGFSGQEHWSGSHAVQQGLISYLFIYSSVYVSIQSSNLSLLPPYPSITISLFSTYVTLFLFYRQVHLYYFFLRFHI